MAAIIAYYLTEIAPNQDQKAEVTTEDVIKYFKGIFPLPKCPQYLLGNAKAAGYFESSGYGKYKLTPVGYNLVAHNLPRSKSGNIPTRSIKSKKTSKNRKADKTKGKVK